MSETDNHAGRGGSYVLTPTGELVRESAQAQPTEQPQAEADKAASPQE